MRLRRILQRIGVVDRHVELAVDDGGEQRVGAFQQFLAGRDVVVELRPGRKQRAVVVSSASANGGTRPEALPKLTNSPGGANAATELVAPEPISLPLML